MFSGLKYDWEVHPLLWCQPFRKVMKSVYWCKERYWYAMQTAVYVNRARWCERFSPSVFTGGAAYSIGVSLFINLAQFLKLIKELVDYFSHA
jgi:hypothetical protein